MKQDSTLEDDLLQILHNFGKCCEALSTDGVCFFAHPGGYLSSKHGLRALGRVLDALALCAICFNILSLYTFADSLLACAALLLAAAATLELATLTSPQQQQRQEVEQQTGACLSGLLLHMESVHMEYLTDYAAALVVLAVLILHMVAEAHMESLALQLGANMLGLLAQVLLVFSLGTAMALSQREREGETAPWRRPRGERHRHTHRHRAQHPPGGARAGGAPADLV